MLSLNNYPVEIKAFALIIRSFLAVSKVISSLFSSLIHHLTRQLTMASTTETQTTTQKTPGHLLSNFPSFFPYHEALTYSTDKFESFLKQDLKSEDGSSSVINASGVEPMDDAMTLVDGSATTTADIRAAVDDMNIDKADAADPTATSHPFMNALHSANAPPERNLENMMLTDNNDLAFRSSKEPLVDLFYEMEEVVSGPQLRDLLIAAWRKDALSTLKIIFNARSIHLGKSSRNTTYKAFGWLAQNHPLTLLMNLQWLTRPIIEKKVGEKKKQEEEDDMVLVEEEKDEDDPSRFDVNNGVAHGYWKDLLNILALAVEGKLDVLAEPRDLLNIENPKSKEKYTWDEGIAKAARKAKKEDRHTAALDAFQNKAFYRDLHLTVARLFAEQLKSDLVLLRNGDKKAARQISLCAKWAPSLGVFHDKHTFICSSIAEILHPEADFKDYVVADEIRQKFSARELYLRNAREAYRKDISALRAALGVVERDISAQKFENIKYDRVPSLAMNRYSSLFIEKDSENFDKYISRVAEGKSKISGATLLPSKLVSAIRSKVSRYNYGGVSKAGKKGSTKALVDAKINEMNFRVIDGQWNTLVQRIRDSGKLENSIAVADVSGSMLSPGFPDGTCPMDSAIGLALLLAEITAPPFGGSFITFSSQPKVEKVVGTTFEEKVKYLENADWGMNTNFESVFSDLILPLAIQHKVKQEDMVKQIFVFSDMQWDQSYAQGEDRYTTSYERIKARYKQAGYEMPQLVFWNLAGGRGGYTGVGDATASKPVTADEEGTVLVSGYSQGMLKVFLDNGAFEDPEAEEEIVDEDGEDEEVVQVKKKQKQNPLSVVRKAISHKAYSMLQVVD